MRFASTATSPPMDFLSSLRGGRPKRLKLCALTRGSPSGLKGPKNTREAPYSHRRSTGPLATAVDAQ